MLKKGFNFYINIIFIFLFAISIIFGSIIQSEWDGILCILMIWIFLGTVRLAFQGIREAFSREKNHHWLMKICITLTIVFALAVEIQLIFVPVVTSDLIKINYDLSQMKDDKLEIDNDAGKFVISKIDDGNRYRIYFPRRIKQINTFCTSYDEAGQHKGRWHWLEGPDFRVKGNYIESRHILGANNNSGKGRYMIVYQHRLTPLEFLKKPTRILVSMFK